MFRSDEEMEQLVREGRLGPISWEVLKSCLAVVLMLLLFAFCAVCGGILLIRCQLRVRFRFLGFARF